MKGPIVNTNLLIQGPELFTLYQINLIFYDNIDFV